MTRGKKVGLLWLAIIILLVAVIWTAVSVKDYFNNLKYKPVLNSNPQYFMTIQGHIDPALIGKIRLKWVSTYASSDARCDVTYNTFEGIIGWRMVEIPYIIKPSVSGDFSLKIPLDYYQPGYCKWQIAEIDDHTGAISSVGYSNIAQFYPCGSSSTCSMTKDNYTPYKNQAQYNNDCAYTKDNKLICRANADSSTFSGDSDLPRNDNFALFENYKLKK